MNTTRQLETPAPTETGSSVAASAVAPELAPTPPGSVPDPDGSVVRGIAGTVGRLVHWFAEAGRQPAPSDLQLLVGPNGTPIWTGDR